MQLTKLMVALGLTASMTACGDKKKGGGGNASANSAELTAAIDCSLARPAAAGNGDAKKGGNKSSGKTKAKAKAKDADDTELELRAAEARRAAADDVDDESESSADDEDTDEADGDDDEVDSATTEEPEARHVPADALVLARKSNTDTMCDVMRGKDQKLAIFGFFSLDCTSCRDRVEEIAKGVSDLGLDDQVLPVVVVTDPKDAMAADEWRDMQDDVAPEAVWGFDSTGEIWRFFGGEKQTSKKIRPWVLLMDQYATGILDKDPDHDVSALIELVNRLLKLEIVVDGQDHGGNSPKPASTSTRTATGVGNATSAATATRTGVSTATQTAAQTSTQAATATRTVAVTATAISTGTGTASATAVTVAPSR